MRVTAARSGVGYDVLTSHTVLAFLHNKRFLWYQQRETIAARGKAGSH